MIQILQALSLAPKVFEAGVEIYKTVTGDTKADIKSPSELVQLAEQLPEPQKLELYERIMQAEREYQVQDTERFKALTEGDANHVKATARPEIALRCMEMMELPFKLLQLVVISLGVLLAAEWLIEAFTTRSIDSPLLILKQVAEFTSWEGALSILAPGYLAAVACIKKYMGCRERDKAHEYELQAGRPLSSGQATVQAAGGLLSGLAELAKVVRK